MSIEIKELIIKVTVNKSQSKTISAVSEMESQMNSFDRKELVSECVEIIMEKLNVKSLR